MIICCKDCKERKLGCHDFCMKYRQEKQDYEAVKKWVKENSFSICKGDFLGDSMLKRKHK